MPKLVCSRLRRIVWSIMWNAALRSNDISTVDEPSSIAWQILSRASNRTDSVEQSRYADWKGLKLQEDVVWYWMRDSIRRSSNFDILFRCDTGQQLLGVFLSRPGFFRRGVTCANLNLKVIHYNKCVKKIVKRV